MRSLNLGTYSKHVVLRPPVEIAQLPVVYQSIGVTSVQLPNSQEYQVPEMDVRLMYIRENPSYT